VSAIEASRADDPMIHRAGRVTLWCNEIGESRRHAIVDADPFGLWWG